MLLKWIKSGFVLDSVCLSIYLSIHLQSPYINLGVLSLSSIKWWGKMFFKPFGTFVCHCEGTFMVCKEPVKVSWHWKFGDFILKTVALVKFILNRKFNREYVEILHCPSSLDPMQILIHSAIKSCAVISSFQNLTSVTVFDVSPLIFRN